MELEEDVEVEVEFAADVIFVLEAVLKSPVWNKKKRENVNQLPRAGNGSDQSQE